MNYFPDKPWNVGDEFENETTGVVYRYDGTKWVATGDSDPLIEYLPITGGEVTGPLLVNDLLEVKEDSVEYQKNRTSITQMSSKEIINAGILDNLMRDPSQYGYLQAYLPLAGGNMTGKLNINVPSQEALTINNDKVKFWSSGAVATSYTNFKDDEFVTKKYVDDRIPSTSNHIAGTGRYKFYEGREMVSLRDGEFGLFDINDNPTSTLAEARSLCWKGVDQNGERPIPDQNAITYVSHAGDCVLLSESGRQMYYRISGGSHIGKDYCVMQYYKDLDTYFLGWGAEVGVSTSTSVSFHHTKVILIKKPELFT